MGPQFDILPFDETLGWGEVMEGERGGMARRGGMRPVRRGGMPRSRQPARRPPPRGMAARWPKPQWPKPRWPRVRGPRYPWYDWPGTILTQPYRTPYEPAPWPEPSEPAPWPEPDEPLEPDDGGGEPPGDDGAPDEEIPPQVRGAINALAPALRPNYVQVRNLPTAPEDPRSNVAGLYLIVFQSGGRWQAYSGQSGNVRRRLLQHRLCARMLGLPVDGHQVFVAAMPSASPAQRRDVEMQLHTRLLAPPLRGILTNVRREMETEVLGPSWR